MPTLAQRAEVLKLARLLGTAPDALDDLLTLPASSLRALREQATATLFDADRRRFVGMANASRMLPLPILTRIIERAFGPLLCARTAGLLPVQRAIDIAERLDTAFLTDTCIELDPRSAAELVASFPVDKVVAIARELVRRDELVTMGRFIDSVSLEAIGAVMAAIEDDGVLLRVSFFAEDVGRLNEIVELLPPARLERIIQFAATADPETWGEAMALIAGVEPKLAHRLAAITGDFERAVLAQVLRSTAAIACWDTLLPIVAAMAEPQQRKIVRLIAEQDEALQVDMLTALAGAGQGALLRSVASIDPPALQALEALSARHGIVLAETRGRRKTSAAR